jgi:hypothetical protein
MERNVITEENIKKTLFNILNEEVSKVKREDFNRVQFKLDELDGSLNDTIRELRKLEDSIPSGLKTVCNGRVSSIGSNLTNTQKLIHQLKDRIKKHKKSMNTQNMMEKKS